MVKGTTRRIVEIRDTGSGYFERAIFFVRMDMPPGVRESTLSQEATRIIDRFCSDLQLKNSRRKTFALNALKIAGAAVGGAAAAFLALKFGVLL